VLRLPNCTAICLDTLNHEQARRAAEWCDRAAEFSDIVVLSDRDVGFRTRHVPVVRSLESYSDFLVHDLIDHCETEFALVFQWDGFITRPERWLDAFMDYDYVGAPWFDGQAFVEVGNGGFSLRSRRLLEVCANSKRPTGENEDTFVCRTVIPRRVDLKVAPTDLARTFSVENAPWSGQTFGFHGSWHFPRFMSDAEVLERLSLQKPWFWMSGQPERWIDSALESGKRDLAEAIAGRIAGRAMDAMRATG
jgi:hypothetical protein